MMRWLIKPSLLECLFLSVPAGAHVLDTVPPGQWYDAPNTQVQAVMVQYPSGTFFGNTSDVRFLDESGASYDTRRDRMIVWGGGHQDYAGNEIYVFDIPSMAWSRVNDPSPRFDPSGTIEDSGYYPDANGNPDPQQPRSRHSYWYQVYVPPIDRYCSVGASFTFPNAHSAANVDCFDFVAKGWQRKHDALTFNGLATAVYDPATGHVWVHGEQWDSTLGFLGEWDPVADTWAKRSAAPSGVKQYAAPALDTKRHRIVYLGGSPGEISYFELNQPGQLVPQVPTLTGDTEILQMERGGLAYDSQNDLLVAWSGDASLNLQPSDIYVIDPITWHSTRTTLSGTAPRLPVTFGGIPGGGTNGVYGRLAYIPTKGAFILINNHLDEDVHFFKLQPSGSAGNPCDLNGDLAVNAIDLQVLANGILAVSNSAALDLNHDGSVNASDAQFLVNVILNVRLCS
jgi:hypothetical protein